MNWLLTFKWWTNRQQLECKTEKYNVKQRDGDW